MIKKNILKNIKYNYAFLLTTIYQLCLNLPRHVKSMPSIVTKFAKSAGGNPSSFRHYNMPAERANFSVKRPAVKSLKRIAIFTQSSVYGKTRKVLTSLRYLLSLMLSRYIKAFAKYSIVCK